MESAKIRPIRLWELFLTFGVLNAGANLIAVYSLQFVTKWIRDPNIYNADVLQQHTDARISFLDMGVPAILIIWYLFPLIWLEFKKNYDNLTLVDRSRFRLIRAPLMSAWISTVGWGIGTLENFVRLWRSGISFHWDYAISVLTHTHLFMILSFVVSFYTLEQVTQKFLVPRLFPHKQLSPYRGRFRITIRLRFFIFFLASCVFPIVLFLDLLRFNLKENLPGEFAEILVLSGVLILILGYLTYLISRSFENPLGSMANATYQIRKGNLEVSAPVLSTDELGFLGESINAMAVDLKEKEFIKDSFGKVVDPKVRDYLLAGNLHLGGELKEATVLFADIRGFTSISERMSPEQVVHLLNRYFDKLSQCIHSEQGFLNKYIGDAVMAVFGAPLPMEQHAEAAVQCGIKMKEEVTKLNEELMQQGFPALYFGIGIHSGHCLAGNIGSSDRLEYTVVGDTVNVAARLESLCKKLGHDFLISENTFHSLNGTKKSFNFKNMVRVKGREEAISIYHYEKLGSRESLSQNPLDVALSGLFHLE